MKHDGAWTNYKMSVPFKKCHLIRTLLWPPCTYRKTLSTIINMAINKLAPTYLYSY